MYWTLFRVISHLKLSPGNILNNSALLPCWHSSIQQTFNQLKCLPVLLQLNCQKKWYNYTKQCYWKFVDNFHFKCHKFFFFTSFVSSCTNSPKEPFQIIIILLNHSTHFWLQSSGGVDNWEPSNMVNISWAWWNNSDFTFFFYLAIFISLFYTYKSFKYDSTILWFVMYIISIFHNFDFVLWFY